MSKYMSLEQTIRKLGAKGVSQPLEKDINDQVHAGGYTSKNFEVSAPAQKMFASLPKDVDADKAEKSLQLHDKLFGIHKKTSATERSTDADVKAAQELHDQIMSLAKEMGIEDKHGHVKNSLDFIKKNLDKESNVKDDIKPDDAAKRFATPDKEYHTDVKNDADIDNISKFRISRDKRAQRKLKIIDDQYNPGVNEMDRIENVSPSFLEALKKVQENATELEEKKKMTKADIAALREPKGKFDEKDLAALRAGEHKKKVDEETEDDDGWNTHKEIHGSNAVSKEDWKKGVRMNSKGEKVNTKKTNEEVEDVEEGVRSIRKATRTWADKKSSTDAAKRLSKKGFTPPGTPSKAEMRKKGEDAVRSFLAKGRKITKEDVEEDEQIDEAQFITIQKGMDKKRVRNNPVEIMQARKDGWAIQEETVEEGNEMKNLAKSQKVSVIKREVQQKKQMFAKKDSADKAKFAKSMQKIHAGDEVEMNGEQIDEALSAAHKTAITGHIKKMWGKGKISFDKQYGKDFVSHSDGIQTHVHSIHMKKGVPHVTHFMSMDESVEQIDELKRSTARKAEMTAKFLAKNPQEEDDSPDAPGRVSDRAAQAQNIRRMRVKKLAKEEFMERAIAILGEDFKDATFEQLAEEIVKRGRGRPRKNPLPDANAPKRGRGRPRKDGGSSSSAAKPEEAGDREHIVMGLRKAISLRGEHGVKFADGSVHKIPAEHAQKALKIHDNLSKPSEKMVFQRKLGASHASFKKALEDKNPGGEEKEKSKITLAKRAEM